MTLTVSIVSAFSFLLSGGVISHAFYQKKQFYPSIVYLTKSNASMAVIYLQALVFVVLFGKLVRKIFFGRLRAAETEHLMERSWHAIIETCLAFTVFRDDFSPRFFAMFTLLLFLKCFHWLGEDRVDYMERSPVITTLFHARMMSLIAVLSAMDSYFMSHAYFTTLIRGASVQLVFGFEYAILLTVVFMISIKYVLHSIDLRSVHPWEGKAVYLLYSELVLSFVKVVLYCVFCAVMIKLHTFPLFTIRPFYLTIRSFKKALNDVVMSRRAIQNMNSLYPDATAEELSAVDNTCIICREEMTGGAKKLPCNHIFHVACLRSWFQRQQTCPTCRLDILSPTAANLPQRPIPGAAAANQQRPAPAAGAGGAAQQPAPQPQAARPAAAQPQPAAFPNFPFFPPGFAQQAAAAAARAAPQEGAAAPSAAAGGSASGVPPMAVPGFPAMLPPMFPPFLLPFAPAPAFAGFTDEEVRQMEGRERAAVQARIQCLRNIQTLLDAASIQLQQYLSIMATVGSSPLFQNTDSGQNDDAIQAGQTSASGENSLDEIRRRRLEHLTGQPAHGHHHDD